MQKRICILHIVVLGIVLAQTGCMSTPYVLEQARAGIQAEDPQRKNLDIGTWEALTYDKSAAAWATLKDGLKTGLGIWGGMELADKLSPRRASGGIVLPQQVGDGNTFEFLYFSGSAQNTDSRQYGDRGQ